jgi:hypothetical protein
LGEAMMLGGLVSYISRPPDRFGLTRTAFLITFGVFIKHNILAIPLAITVDLAIRSPRQLLFWLACCVGLAAVFLWLAHLIAGGTFIDHLLSPRIFTGHGMRYHLMKYLRFFEFPLLPILLFSRAIFSRSRLILAVYGISSIATATILAGFEGTSYNMFQDAAVFLAIAVGVMLHELRKRIAAPGPGRERLATVVLGAVPLLLAHPILARSPEAFGRVYNVGALLEFDRRADLFWLKLRMWRGGMGRRSARVFFSVITPASHSPWTRSTHASTSWPAGSIKAN